MHLAELNNIGLTQLEAVLSRLEWNCNVQYDTKELSGPSYRIMFYLDSEGTQHLVGAAAIFAGMTTSVEMPNTIVTMDVPLTHELLAPTANLTSPAVVPVLTEQLYWTVERINEDGSITVVPVADIPSLKIATFSTVAEYPADISELPRKGNETIFLDPTKDKEGGLGPADDTAPFIDIIGDDVPDVVEGDEGAVVEDGEGDDDEGDDDEGNDEGDDDEGDGDEGDSDEGDEVSEIVD